MTAAVKQPGVQLFAVGVEPEFTAALESLGLPAAAAEQPRPGRGEGRYRPADGKPAGGKPVGGKRVSHLVSVFPMEACRGGGQERFGEALTIGMEK